MHPKKSEPRESRPEESLDEADREASLDLTPDLAAELDRRLAEHMAGAAGRWLHKHTETADFSGLTNCHAEAPT